MSELEGDETSNKRDGLLMEEDHNPHLESRDHPTFHARQIHQLGAWKSYLQSHEGLEILFSLSVFGVSLIADFIDLDPRQRFIPYQQLESTGEYIVNQVYNETFEGETVPSGWLFVYGVLLPFAVQMLFSFFLGNSDMHKTACVYGTAIGLTNLLTNFAKLYVGYLRPLFYDVCVPDDAYEYCSSGEDNSARKSFPSGHSSISFCGLGLLSFYLEWRFGVSSLRSWHQDSSVVSGEIMVMTQRRPLRLERIKSIFCYAPMLLAGFIATSRIVDNKHFPSDVVGGSILGAAIAKLVHGIWYD